MVVGVGRGGLLDPAGPHGVPDPEAGGAARSQFELNLVSEPPGQPVARGFQGQSSDIEIHARETLALRPVDELYAQHTDQTVERVHADMDRDRYFTSPEAVALTV